MLLELNFRKRCLTAFGIIFIGLSLAICVSNNPLALALVSICLVCLLTKNVIINTYAIVATFRRDITGGVRFLKLNYRLLKWSRQRKTVPQIFRDVVKRHPNKVAYIMDNKTLNFQQLDDLSNTIASYFKSKNFKRSDTVALFMETRPEYPAIWIGLSKIGVTTALINTNLRKEPLAHCIKVADSKAIITGVELKEGEPPFLHYKLNLSKLSILALNEIGHKEGIKGIPVFHFYDDDQRENGNNFHFEDSTDLITELNNHEVTDVTEDILSGNLKDKMVYIYTSGTTGLPKAAVITHLRYLFMCIASCEMIEIREDDIIYNPLPIYHTAGGIIGVGSVLLRGVTMVMRKKFSASNFWTDCNKYNCTLAQYIGELCRYLLATPQKPTDTQHNLRMMFGNGLRPQIWKQFVSRFNIPSIGEFYGATEGNSNLVNFDNQVGAIGFVPLLAGKLYPVMLIKCDEDTGEPIRNSVGKCIVCNPGEPGVFIGKINPRIASSSFNGYADKNESEKKIIRNVFQNGDSYFNSGDILVKDILGYFYFKDRTGDTFRWRGENVSTSEVEAVISNILALKDCVVYGVEIPHVEGKAGMASIVDESEAIDMDQLSVGIRGSLPTYARPLFIRILPKLPMTGTFKLKKRDLQIEGFDINKISDPVYFLRGVSYQRFRREDYNDIQEGKAGL